MVENQHERLRGHRIRTTLRRVPGIHDDLGPTLKHGGGEGTSDPKTPISEATHGFYAQQSAVFVWDSIWFSPAWLRCSTAPTTLIQ